MSKRVLIVLAGILGLIIIVIGFIIFVNARSNSQNSTTQQAVNNVNNSATSNNGSTTSDNSGNAQNTGSAATNNSQQLKKISDGAVIAPALSYDGKAVWYFTADGHLYKIDLSTGLKQEYLLKQQIPVTDAIWPTTGNDFIIVSGSGASKVFYYYSSDAKDFTTYPASITGVDFIPDGQHIAYDWFSGGKAYFSVADLDTKNFQDIVPLPSAGLTIKVSPLGNKAFAYDASNPGDGKLNLIDLSNKTLVTLHTGLDNSVAWSPDGVKFVYNRNPQGQVKDNSLWLGDSAAVTNKNINLDGSVSKVAFDSKGDYLFVSAVNPDDGTESLWKVDTHSLVKTQIFKINDLVTKINASNLMVSPDDKTLYFKNSDGFLYSVNIGN